MKAQKAEPKMATHPDLRTAESPDGDAFSGAEQSGEDYESKTERTEEQADRTAAAETIVRSPAREEIDDRASREDRHGGDCPCALGLVDTH